MKEKSQELANTLRSRELVPKLEKKICWYTKPDLFLASYGEVLDFGDPRPHLVPVLISSSHLLQRMGNGEGRRRERRA